MEFKYDHNSGNWCGASGINRIIMEFKYLIPGAKSITIPELIES